MNVSKIIASGFVGTSLMTLFSYIVSTIKRKNFKEPELLADLEKDALQYNAKELSLPAGWSTHYSIGIVWAIVYHLLWEKTTIKPRVKSGLILGGISGLTGVVFWDTFFKIHPDPPRIDYKRFYGHLVLAHLVYGVFVTISGKNYK